MKKSTKKKFNKVLEGLKGVGKALNEGSEGANIKGFVEPPAFNTRSENPFSGLNHRTENPFERLNEPYKPIHTHQNEINPNYKPTASTARHRHNYACTTCGKQL